MMLKRSLLPLWAVLVFSVSLQAQEHYERFSQIDVQHYRFQLELNDQNNEVKGKAMVKVRFKDNIRSFHLDLVSESGGSGMRVEEVSENGETISFEQQGERLEIELGSRTQEGEERTYLISYQGTPKDGLVIGQNKHGDRTFFGDNWPNRARHWLPSVDHPSDKASVEFVVTAPNHYQVVANGRLVEETDLDDDTKLTHWKTDIVLPTKVMVIGVAPFAVQYLEDIQGIPMSSWIFPQDRDAGFYDYSQATYVLHWFIDHVGPYPYAKLANVQSKTRYGGMENAGNIFYSENSVRGNRSIEGLLAHEIAHQWFGNSASEADWHHVWLSEGFATYFTDLYMEWRYGRDRLEERMQSERSAVLQFAANNDAPIVDESITNYNRLLNTNSYQKGGWVLHMLRNQVGEDAFWAGIHEYYKQYQYGNALTSDFQKVMEEASGQDLEWFFQQWIFRGGVPELEVDWKYRKKENRLDVTVRQKQGGQPYRLNLEVIILDKKGESLVSKTLEISTNKQEYSIEGVGEKPEKMILDPHVNLLFSSSQ
jgi:aminopeptidase N